MAGKSSSSQGLVPMDRRAPLSEVYAAKLDPRKLFLSGVDPDQVGVTAARVATIVRKTLTNMGERPDELREVWKLQRRPTRSGQSSFGLLFCSDRVARICLNNGLFHCQGFGTWNFSVFGTTSSDPEPAGESRRAKRARHARENDVWRDVPEASADEIPEPWSSPGPETVPEWCESGLCDQDSGIAEEEGWMIEDFETVTFSEQVPYIPEAPSNQHHVRLLAAGRKAFMWEKQASLPLGKAQLQDLERDILKFHGLDRSLPIAIIDVQPFCRALIPEERHLKHSGTHPAWIMQALKDLRLLQSVTEALDTETTRLLSRLDARAKYDPERSPCIVVVTLDGDLGHHHGSAWATLLAHCFRTRGWSTTLTVAAADGQHCPCNLCIPEHSLPVEVKQVARHCLLKGFLLGTTASAEEIAPPPDDLLADISCCWSISGPGPQARQAR